MQTFLVYPDYAESAKVLDMKRLGKQRVETYQILNALRSDGPNAWKNHPAQRMWKGYENALVEYGIAICLEWKARGYKDTCLEKIQAHYNNNEPNIKPPWFGDEQFHLSHRANLVRKAPEIYKKLWPDVDPEMPYVWPVEKLNKDKVNNKS